MPISISMIVLGSQLVMPVADGVPKFDIARSASSTLPHPPASPLISRQRAASVTNGKARAAARKPVGQNSPRQAGQVAPRKRALAAHQVNVSLLTCLQMGQWSR